MGWTDFLSQGISGAIFGRQAAAQASSMSAFDKAKYLFSHPLFKKSAPRSSSMGTPYYLARGGGDDSGVDFALDSDTGAMRRRPRMNVMNSHAARRAVRRLRGALKLLHRIERTMPHRACKRTHTRGHFGRR